MQNHRKSRVFIINDPRGAIGGAFVLRLKERRFGSLLNRFDFVAIVDSWAVASVSLKKELPSVDKQKIVAIFYDNGLINPPSRQSPNINQRYVNPLPIITSTKQPSEKSQSSTIDEAVFPPFCRCFSPFENVSIFVMEMGLSPGTSFAGLALIHQKWSTSRARGFCVFGLEKMGKESRKTTSVRSTK